MEGVPAVLIQVDPAAPNFIGQVLEVELLFDLFTEFLTHGDYMRLSRTCAYNRSILILTAPWKETFQALRPAQLEEVQLN